MRTFDARAFDAAFHDVVVAGSWQGKHRLLPKIPLTVRGGTTGLRENVA
jgi:hypothetical protein